MLRCAITGVAGYLGQRLLAELAARAEVSHVVGLDVRAPAMNLPKLSFHQVDVRDPALPGILWAERVDTLIHLAFVVDPIHNARLMHDVNVNGTRNLLEAVRGTAITQVLVTSSVQVYGAWPDNPVPLREEDRLRPNPDFQYAVDKAAVDVLCQGFAAQNADLAVAIVRPALVLGPHVDNYVTRYLRQWPALPVIRGGDAPMQFVHEDDVVALFLAILRQRARGVYNLGGGGTLRWSTVIRRAGRIPVVVPARVMYPLAEALWRLRIPGVGAPAGQLNLTRFPYIMSMAKAERELGFRPRYSTAEALEAFCGRWYNPAQQRG